METMAENCKLNEDENAQYIYLSQMQHTKRFLKLVGSKKSKRERARDKKNKLHVWIMF